jgi:hypothetical protein
MLNFVGFKVILIIIAFVLFCLPTDGKGRNVNIMAEKETNRNVHFCDYLSEKCD